MPNPLHKIISTLLSSKSHDCQVPGKYKDLADTILFYHDFEESWAVSVEAFFELPSELKTYLPGIYTTL